CVSGHARTVPEVAPRTGHDVPGTGAAGMGGAASASAQVARIASAREQGREGAQQTRRVLGVLPAQRTEDVLHLVRREVAVIAVDTGALDDRGDVQLGMELGRVLPGADA